MSNDELQKAIDDITRDNVAPVSEKASEETEALVNEMVGGGTQQGVGAAGFGIPAAPAPEVPGNPGMPPRLDKVEAQESAGQGGEMGMNAEMGSGNGGENSDTVKAQEQMGDFQERLSQQFGGEAPKVNRGLNDNTEEMAPISAFSGVKVEAPEVPEVPKEEERKDYGKEMEKETVLSDIAKEAIKELYPLLDKVEVSADEKFEICMEAAEETPEAISGALNAAKRIEDEKARAEALLRIVKYSK